MIGLFDRARAAEEARVAAWGLAHLAEETERLAQPSDRHVGWWRLARYRWRRFWWCYWPATLTYLLMLVLLADGGLLIRWGWS